MNKKIISVLFLLVLIAGLVFLMRSYRSSPEAEEAAVKTAVITLVENFGNALKNVSLLSPTASEDIEKNYKDFLDPDLLEAWESDPSQALGRITSSPWPERIEIGEISRFDSEAYDISGKIIEMTSTGMSGSRAVQINVAKFGNRWLITGIYVFPYQVDDSWKEYEGNGISFEYPETLGAEYISETEWPPTVEIRSGDDNKCWEGITVSSAYPIYFREVMDKTIYCIDVSEEGAAGSVYKSYTYISPRRGRLVALSFVLRYPNCLNYPEDQARTCAKEREFFDLDALVNNIFQTIKFESASNTLADQIARCLVSSSSEGQEKCDELLKQITDFDSCVMAGFPVTKSDSLTQCQVGGKIFTEGENSSWEEVVSAINNCEAATVVPSWRLLVTVILKNDRQLIAVEPERDDILDVTAAAEAKCGPIEIIPLPSD